MDELLEKYLDKALEFEAKGAVDEAVLLLDKLAEAFIQNRGIFLAEKAKLEFRNNRDKEALRDFIQSYAADGNEEIYSLVLEAYLEPNKEMLRRQYEENMQMLQNYAHYKNDFEAEKLDVYVLWMDEETAYIVNTAKKAFGTVPHVRHGEIERKAVPFMMINQLWLSDILCSMEQTKIEKPFMDMGVPFYLQYDRNYWMMFAQMARVDELVRGNCTVFLVGEQSFSDYFEDEAALPPVRMVNGGIQTHYENRVAAVLDHRAQQLEQYKKENAVYYRENETKIIQHIQSRKPRILFYTCRFTTIVQYHTRDCREAAERTGCETELLIEPDGIHRLTELACQKCIRDFKPDMIFCIDHFRFEQYSVPKELVWITWAQDPLEAIMDKASPSKLTDRDFVLNHFTTWRKFKDIGYDERLLIEAPIPADSKIYKPYQLNEEEWQQYACDICFVCHASDVDQHVEQAAAVFPEEFREMIRAVYYGYKDFVDQTGELFYEEGVFASYIKGAMQQKFNYSLNGEVLAWLANDMCMWFNQRVFRQALADWIIDAGFTDLKLWGNGWKGIAKYEKCAMGPAQNGETLSKIYQASKIVIGNNCLTTSAARAWETMLSGGFYLSNYIPPESDITDIRKIVRADEDVVMFYSKEDLIQKLHYYLEREEERKMMAERGRKAALEKMTFDTLMERTLAEIAKRLEGTAA